MLHKDEAAGAVVFMLGLCQEVQTQRRGRENERFLPLSPRTESGGTLSFYWVCEESPNPGEEEEESTLRVVIVITPAVKDGVDADFAAGPVN